MTRQQKRKGLCRSILNNVKFRWFCHDDVGMLVVVVMTNDDDNVGDDVDGAGQCTYH